VFYTTNLPGGGTDGLVAIDTSSDTALAPATATVPRRGHFCVAFLILQRATRPRALLGSSAPPKRIFSPGDAASQALAVEKADVLFVGGTLFNGSGEEPIQADLGIRDGRIVFIGDAEEAGYGAAEVIDVSGLWVAPGFIDAHSHAALDTEYGRASLPFLYQGITTVVLGIDGGGGSDVAERFRSWRENGIGLNGILYVGHGAARRAAMGSENRPPTPEEMEAIKAFVRKGMEEGAFGLSTGLFYVPGTYATTEEVIEVAKVAAEWEGAIYDTHDRDLGAVYQGVGYDASVREAIRIGEESGLRVVFSHYNLQGAHNYGRADVGARYVNEARERGVEVWAAHHPYTATHSNLRSYTVPDWAAAGGQEEMIRRFDDPLHERREVAHPHQDHERVDCASELGPASLLRDARGILVTRHDGEGGRVAPVREGNAGEGRRGQRRAHAGHHLTGHPGRAAGADLLAAATEHEGIAALETDHMKAPARQRHQQGLDLRLAASGALVAALAHVDAVRRLGSEGQQLGRHELVVEHDVGLAQHAGTLQGQQAGMPRSRAHQHDAARRAQSAAPAAIAARMSAAPSASARSARSVPSAAAFSTAASPATCTTLAPEGSATRPRMRTRPRSSGCA